MKKEKQKKNKDAPEKYLGIKKWRKKEGNREEEQQRSTRKISGKKNEEKEGKNEKRA